MSGESDTLQYLPLFLAELEEQVAFLEQEILQLEQEVSAERLQAIFRAVHTIKGSARTMGFAKLAQVAHEMENLLDRLRKGQASFGPKCGDVLLRCLDTLRTLHHSIAKGGGDSVETADVVQELQALWQADQPDTATENGFEVTIALREDCQEPYLRALLCMARAGELGRVVSTTPSDAELEGGQFDRRLHILLRTSASPDAVRTKLCAIPEVSEVEVRPAHTEQPQGPGIGEGKPEASPTVRVDLAKLDSLMNLVGELVVERSRLQRSVERLVSPRLDAVGSDALLDMLGRLSLVTNTLQEQVTKLRMLPIETVFRRLPRAVRDIANETGKLVKLRLEGGETEMDRSVIEAISDPLLHILRNSVDHGIEKPEARQKAGKPEEGTIRVSARPEGNQIIVEITDDGAGIDAEKLKTRSVQLGVLSQEAASRLTYREACELIFQSGISTATRVTEVSGRGVGMDIVRSNLHKLGGMVEVDSELGKGTRFRLHLPLTLAILQGLTVSVEGAVFVVPVRNVIEALAVGAEEIRRIEKHAVLDFRGRTVPVLRASEVLGLSGDNAQASGPRVSKLSIVVLGTAEQRFGLIVDELICDQEVVVKPLDSFWGDVHCVGGSTVLPDGDIGLILDVARLAQASAA